MSEDKEIEAIKAHLEAISRRLKALEERISKIEYYQIRKKLRGWL